jgi:hypothetical protein
MTSSTGSEMNSHDEMGDVLSRVRQLDPTIDDAAVRRYVREISEADAVLGAVDLSDAPVLVPFTASWSEGLVR